MPYQPAHSILNNITTAHQRVPSAQPSAQNVIATNPMFGRPLWTYAQPVEAPRRGPVPRLANGTGSSGQQAQGGNNANLPGYVSEPNYHLTIQDYQPGNQQAFSLNVPRTISVGDDGLHALNPTYRAHDFTPGQRFFSHMRQAPNWQVMTYPPNYRNLLGWQQVMRYRVNSVTQSARPLDSSAYFLGYQTNPNTVSPIGQNGLGYMGSM